MTQSVRLSYSTAKRCEILPGVLSISSANVQSRDFDTGMKYAALYLNVQETWLVMLSCDV